MELNEFITNVLVEIESGIKNANSKLGNHSFEIEAYRRDSETGFISFDIAVRTSDENGKDAKAGILVLNLGVGGSMKNSSVQEQANRIKFFILPSRNIG